MSLQHPFCGLVADVLGFRANIYAALLSAHVYLYLWPSAEPLCFHLDPTVRYHHLCPWAPIWSLLPLPLLPSLAFICSGGTIQTTSRLAERNYAVVWGPERVQRRDNAAMPSRLRLHHGQTQDGFISTELCRKLLSLGYLSSFIPHCSLFSVLHHLLILICLYTHSYTPHTLFCSSCLQGRPLPWQACVQSRGVNLASAHSSGGWFKWRPVGWKDTYVKEVKLTRTQACCAHGCVACVYVLTLALWPPSIPYCST